MLSIEMDFIVKKCRKKGFSDVKIYGPDSEMAKEKLKLIKLVDDEVKARGLVEKVREIKSEFVSKNQLVHRDLLSKCLYFKLDDKITKIEYDLLVDKLFKLYRKRVIKKSSLSKLMKINQIIIKKR